LTRQEIYEKADEILTKKGVNPNDFHKTIAMEDRLIESSAVSYILEQADFSTLKQANAHAGFHGWRIRFFKPLEKEEYAVLVFPDGRLFDIVHTVDEQMPGAKLSLEEALAVARKYLEEDHDFDESHYETVVQEAQQRENRIDYHFIFEKSDVSLGEAKYRIEADVIGDEPSSFKASLKIPEEWLRKREATTVKNVVIWSILTVIFIGIIFLLLN
jgi:hypothetical protein